MQWLTCRTMEYFLHQLSIIKRYISIPRHEIAYMQFIFESYEGLATLSTIDPGKGLLMLSIPSCFEPEVESLLQALRKEISIIDIPFEETLSDVWVL